MTSATEFAPGLAIQGFTAPLKLQDFKLIAFDMDSTLINIECIDLSLIHISEPTRLQLISYAVFCLKK